MYVLKGSGVPMGITYPWSTIDHKPRERRGRGKIPKRKKLKSPSGNDKYSWNSIIA